MNMEWKEIKRRVYMNRFGTARRKEYLKTAIIKGDGYDIYKFLLHLRQYEYLIKQKGGPILTCRRVWHLRKYQKHAQRLGYSIGDGVLGEDVVLYHRGSIIINPDARVGAGCKFHGDCTIGVARTGEKGCPVLGKNVDIGVGARILGGIYIADNIVIGANSVVTKTFDEPGITIAGIPAKKVEHKSKETILQP